MVNPQKENGYTAIANEILDELVKVSLLGTELSICLFVIRKTYGFQKKEDEISLTQFELGIKRSRPTITKALKNLQLVNILKLVKKGNTKGACNIWSFNKCYDTWKVVKIPQLVKDRTKPSKEKLKNLVKIPLHTKEITKETKEKSETSSPEIPLIIKAFESINPASKRFYGNITQRKACEDLITTYTFERVKAVIENTLPKTNKIKFMPNIRSPLQLYEKWSALEDEIFKLKNKGQEIKNKVAFN